MRSPATPTVPAIELEEVFKSFGGQPVLCGVNLRVAPGTTYALLGRSGAGKTVLLKHAAGLLHPDRGHVRVDGEDLAELSQVGLQRVWRKIGIVFQGGALFDSVTVFDNVAFPLRERTHLGSAEIARQVRRSFHLLDLDGVEAEYPANLSGGMRKRVALARAIVLEPRILLYDDPTAGLDPILSSHVAEALVELRRKLGVTSLVITHDVPVAFQVADLVGLLHQGRIVAEGRPADFRLSQHPAVVAFLHSWLERHHAGQESAARP